MHQVEGFAVPCASALLNPHVETQFPESFAVSNALEEKFSSLALKVYFLEDFNSNFEQTQLSSTPEDPDELV